LFYGNWEYDDDPSTLINYEKILDCFTCTDNLEHSGVYITADIARFGSDKTVIGVWHGWEVKLYAFRGLSVAESAKKIKEFAEKYKVGTNGIIADEDGVGGGVVDILKC